MAAGIHREVKKKKYIHDLPYADFQRLCDILDYDDKWEELGGVHLKFDLFLLQKFRRSLYCRGSPTKELLIHWKTLNGTIDLLFVYLSKMKHFQAMEVLYPYVSEKIRYLLPKDPGCTTMLKSIRNTGYIKSSMDNGWPQHNYPNNQMHGMYQSQPQFFNPSMEFPGHGNNMFHMMQQYPKTPEEQYVPQCCDTIPNSGFITPNSANAKSHPMKSHPPIENFDYTSIEESMLSKDILSSPKIQNTAAKQWDENSLNKPSLHNSFPDLNHKNNSKEQPLPNDKSSAFHMTNVNIGSAKIDNQNVKNLPRKLSDDNNVSERNKTTVEVEHSLKNLSCKVPSIPLKNLEKEENSKTPNKNSSTPESLFPQSTVLQIPYEEIVAATRSFDKILGKGGFGTVYYGEWKNQPVAIKFIKRKDNPGFSVEEDAKLKQSLTELKTLDSCRHDNILPLYGYCLNKIGLCLIYRYMCNGSLEDRLHCRDNTPPLTWYQRCQIIKGVASGIDYLHSLTIPLIHGDIKSANILLDKSLDPRLGDFGLVRKAEFDEKSYIFVKHLNGTKPYLPDEYLRNHKLSKKLDTYSFGVVLYEVATAERAYDEKRPRITARLVDYVKSNQDNLDVIRDKRAGNDFLDVFKLLVILGQRCTQTLPKQRPEMSEIVTYVSHQLQVIEGHIYARKKSLENLIQNPSLPADDRLKIQHQLLIQAAGFYSYDYHAKYPILFSPKITVQEESQQQMPQNVNPRPKIPVEQTVPVTHITTDLYQPNSSLIGLISNDLKNNTQPPSYNEALEVSYAYPPDINEEEFSLPGANQQNLANGTFTEAAPNDLPNLTIFNNQIGTNNHVTSTGQQNPLSTEAGNPLSSNHPNSALAPDQVLPSVDENNERSSISVQHTASNISQNNSQYNQSVGQVGTKLNGEHEAVACEFLTAPSTAKNKNLDQYLKLASNELHEELDEKVHINQ